jgi:hypothetical protein
MSNPNQIYKVTTEGDCEGKSIHTIAYARGDPEDIKVHYDKAKMYKISLSPIEIIDITPKSVMKTRALFDEKKDLEKRLKKIQKSLEKKGFR